jgi:hypothetical protein
MGTSACLGSPSIYLHTHQAITRSDADTARLLKYEKSAMTDLFKHFQDFFRSGGFNKALIKA